MDSKKRIIKKTTINGQIVSVPLKPSPVVIDKAIEVTDLLSLGENVAYSQLTRLLTISKERAFTPDEGYLFGIFVKSIVEIQKVKKLELKDLDLEGMGTDDLIKLAEKYLIKDN